MKLVIKLKINDEFIEKWHPIYDELEDDEEEYKLIINQVHKDIVKENTLSYNTFIQILNWKAPRAKGIIRLNKFDIYKNALKRCIEYPNDKKIAILDDLWGIGVPIASTILQFIYPEEFPIMDVRTIGVLYKAGYINSKSKSQKQRGSL